MSESEMLTCVLGLTLAQFRKTMPSHYCPGRWQDVYEPVCDGTRLYVKLQLASDTRTGDRAIIVSFKPNHRQ